MRRSALDRTRLHGSYTGSDRTLLLELVMQGPFYEVPERLFLSREHDARSIRIRKNSNHNAHVREAWFDSNRADKIVFPNWRRLRELVTASANAPLPWRDRARVAGVIGQSMLDGSWKRLAYDVRVAAETVVRRPTQKSSR